MRNSFSCRAFLTFYIFSRNLVKEEEPTRELSLYKSPLATALNYGQNANPNANYLSPENHEG